MALWAASVACVVWSDRWDVNMLGAFLMAVFWQQCGWLAHDFLHHQVGGGGVSHVSGRFFSSAICAGPEAGSFSRLQVYKVVEGERGGGGGPPGNKVRCKNATLEVNYPATLPPLLGSFVHA